MSRYRKSIHQTLKEVGEWQPPTEPEVLIEEAPIPTETGRELLKKRIAHRKVEKKELKYYPMGDVFRGKLQKTTQYLKEALELDDELAEAVKWEVKVSGLPVFYSDGKSKGSVRQMLRKLLKHPDDIQSISRVTSAELKKIRRGQIAGDEPGEDEDKNPVGPDYNEDVELDELSPELAKRAYQGARKKRQQIFNKSDETDRIPNVKKQDRQAKKFAGYAAKNEAELPKHLTNFLDRHGNPNKEAAARIEAGRKKRAADAAKAKIKDVTPPGYGPKEEVEMAIMSLDHKEDARKLKITQQGLDALRAARDKPKPKVKTHVRITKAGREAIKGDPIRPMDEWGDTGPLARQDVITHGRRDLAPKKKAAAQAKDKKNQNKPPVGPQHEMAERLLKKLREVAPPRWGHTVPDKPKGAKVGGTAQAMKKAQERGDIPKDMNIYALMWSMKNKGDNPHYKPGEKGVLKKKYKNNESVLDSAKRYVIDERADWETAFKSASQSRPAMKYKDAAAFIDTAGLSSTEKRTALKSAKKWLK